MPDNINDEVVNDTLDTDRVLTLAQRGYDISQLGCAQTAADFNLKAWLTNKVVLMNMSDQQAIVLLTHEETKCISEEYGGAVGLDNVAMSVKRELRHDKYCEIFRMAPRSIAKRDTRKVYVSVFGTNGKVYRSNRKVKKGRYYKFQLVD